MKATGGARVCTKVKFVKKRIPFHVDGEFLLPVRVDLTGKPHVMLP